MYKRWFALVLTIALIPGCSGRTIETAPSEALYETKPTETVGFSSFCDVPETGGAIQSAPLPVRDVSGFCFFGEDILVFSGKGNTTLTLLDRHSLAVKAETALSLPVSLHDPDVTVSCEAITYVDAAARELVVLNAGLEEAARISQPEGCTQGVLSADQQHLYYCTADAVRILELHSGIDRPIREMDYPQQRVDALHCADSVLQCRVTDADGTSCMLFLSAEDGRLLCEAAESTLLWTEQDLYFSVHTDGAYRELLAGSRDFGPSLLVPETEPVAITPVLQQKTVLLHTQSPEGNTVLDAYHTENGKHLAQTALPEGFEILEIQAGFQSECLWLLCHDRNSDRDMLCRWELSRSVVDDPRNYLQPRRSRERPDQEGLSQCQELAAALSRKHGVRIHVSDNLMPFSMGQYQLLPEYQVPLLRQTLPELDAALSRYPAGFLEELADPTEGGLLNICPVRSILSEDPSESGIPSLLYRDAQGDIWLAVVIGTELTAQIDPMLCSLIDSRVLSVSDAYDSWDRRSNSGSAHQERVCLLERAMQADQADYFSSGYMQSTLRQLCFGIRETFQTARDADRLLWEQHIRQDP